MRENDRFVMKPAIILYLCFFLVAVGHAQDTPSHPGVVLYGQGKFADAVRSLETAVKSKEYKSDADIWNYLGLAYFASGDFKKSNKAFEKSVSLNPSSATFRANLADAYLTTGQVKKAFSAAEKSIELDPQNPAGYHVRGIVNLWHNKLEQAAFDADLAIKLDPSNARGYVLKSETLLSKLSNQLAAGRKIKEEIELLKTATEVLEIGAAKANESPHFDRLQRDLESVSIFYKHFTRNTTPPESTPTAVGPGPSVTPLRILSKKPAAYTDAARSAGIEGVIRLSAIFSASGKIESVLFLKRLGYGLEQNVLAAVREIRFEPKQVDGKPVSTVMTLEYSFDIY